MTHINIKLVANGMVLVARTPLNNTTLASAIAMASDNSAIERYRRLGIELVAALIIGTQRLGGAPPKHSFAKTPSAWMSAGMSMSPPVNCSGAA